MKKLLTTVTILFSFSCHSMTLTEALVQAYNFNPDLISEREKLRATDEDEFAAISGFLPRIYFTSQFNKQRRNRENFNLNERTTQILKHKREDKTYVNSLVLEQSIFNGGGTMARFEIAKNKIDVGRAQLSLKEQEVLLNVVKAYNEVIYQKNLVIISKNNVKALEDNLNAVENKYEAGLVKRTDLALSRAELASARNELITVEGNYVQSLANFKKEVGLEAVNLEENIITPNLPNDLEDSINLSLKYNPNILAAHASKSQAESDLKLQITEMWPDLSLKAESTNQYSKTKNSTTTLNGESPKTHSNSITLNLNVPIYNRGLEYSNIRKAKATVSQAKSNYRRAVDAIRDNATQAWVNYNSSVSKLGSAVQAEKSYAIALDGLKREYEEGLTSITDLLKGRVDYFSSQSRLLIAKRDINNAAYSLKASTGKLSAQELELPTTIYNPKDNTPKFKLIGF